MAAPEKLPESAAGKKIRNGSGLFLVAIIVAFFGWMISSIFVPSASTAPGIFGTILAGGILLLISAILFIIGCFYVLAGIATYFDQRLLNDAKLLDAQGFEKDPQLPL